MPTRPVDASSIPPYQLAYNMKFPGTYAAYAGIMALFGKPRQGFTSECCA